MFHHNQKYAEIQHYRAEAERRAEQHRLVIVARHAQRIQRRHARFVTLRSGQARLLTLVGRALVNWGNRLQADQPVRFSTPPPAVGEHPACPPLV